MRLALEVTIGKAKVPPEYNVFVFCREMGYTWDEFEELPTHIYQEWLAYMHAEADARELHSKVR